MIAGSLPDDDDSRALIHVKNNIGPLGPSLSFVIDKEGHFEWKGGTTITAADLLAAPAEPGDRKIIEAKRWLFELLQSGSREQKEIRELSEYAGISWRTVRRAKDALGVISHKAGMSEGWFWSLNEDAHSDVHTEKLDTFGESGHLATCPSIKKMSNINPLDLEEVQKNCVGTLARKSKEPTDRDSHVHSTLNRRRKEIL
jgi:hypothetical protein